MKKCEDIQKELDAFLSGDTDELKRKEIQIHLNECQDCSQALRQLTRLSEVLQTWKGIEPSPLMYEKLKSRIRAHESSWKKIIAYVFSKKAAFRFAEVAAVVVLTLLISHLLQKPASRTPEDLSAINFYLHEHQGAVVETISAELLTRPATKMFVGLDDILYFEFIEDFPGFSKPGVIIKGPPTRTVIQLPKAPTITKGRILNLPKIQDAVDFDPVVPSRLPHGYILDSIRKINDHDCLHLLYIKDLDTVSLFEQPINRKGGLAAQDFREYAVYSHVEPDLDSKGQSKVTILAWNNGNLSFVLIGRATVPQLMDIVHSIGNNQEKMTGGTSPLSKIFHN